MGSAGFIAGCLIGVSILYTAIMGVIAIKTVPTRRLELEESGEVKE